MAAAQTSIAVPPAGKMCRSNTCRKSHFVRKIKQVQIVRPFGAGRHFLRIAQFSAAIEAAHFPAETTRPLGPRLSAIFTSLSIFLYRRISLFNVNERGVFIEYNLLDFAHVKLQVITQYIKNHEKCTKYVQQKYKHPFLSRKICIVPNNPYICTKNLVMRSMTSLINPFEDLRL